MLKLTIYMSISELPEFCHFCDEKLNVSKGKHKGEWACDECKNVYHHSETGWSTYSPYPERRKRGLGPRLKSPKRTPQPIKGSGIEL